MTVQRKSQVDDDPVAQMLAEFFATGRYSLVPGATRWGLELAYPPPQRRALWLERRNQILTEWRASGRRGVPWAEREWGAQPVASRPRSTNGHLEGGSDE